MVHFALWPTGFEIQVFRKSKQIRNAPNDLRKNIEHLTVKIVLHSQITYPRSPNFGLFHFYYDDFSRYNMSKIAKSSAMQRMTPNNFEHLTVKSTGMYTLSSSPRGRNFSPFRFTTSCSQDTYLSKIAKRNKKKKKESTEWPQNDLEYLMAVNTYPWGSNVVTICCATSSFQNTKVVENRKIRKCTE